MYKTIVIIGLLLLAMPSYAALDVRVESLQISHKTTVVTVADTATAIPATALSGRKVVMVQNIGTVTVYLGNSAVTADEAATGGYQLINEGDTWVGDFTDDVVVYGIVASGTSSVVVWEAR